MGAARRHTWKWGELEQKSNRRKLGSPPWLFTGSVGSLRYARSDIGYRAEAGTGPPPIPYPCRPNRLVVSEQGMYLSPSTGTFPAYYTRRQIVSFGRNGWLPTVRPLVAQKPKTMECAGMALVGNLRKPRRWAAERHSSTSRDGRRSKSVLLRDHWHDL